MDNRNKILECAMDLFASRGYNAVGVQEIVEAAGITKPTLYHYFGSKRGLLEVVFSEKAEILINRVSAAANYNGDITLTLENTCRTLFEFSKTNPTFFRIFLALWFAPVDSEAFQVASEYNRKLFDVIENIFLQAVTEHGNMRGRHASYGISFLGTINSNIGLNLNGQIKLDDQLVHHCVHQFMHGILS